MSGALKQTKSSSEKLALLGGPKVFESPMPIYSSYGEEEKKAALAVLEKGVLSKFIGAWTPDFYGGEYVQKFERAWEAHFKVSHAVSVNSATSGLICALGALDLEPGDEVICSPWTMSADPAAILVWNAIPVFADIERKTFNLCPESIRKNLSPRTKAILVSDIFGHAADLTEILKIAREKNIKVIEDAAQAPGAYFEEKFLGTVADIGIYSLNYHKHIHTGEGGICVTNDPNLAERMQLIRNHAESVVNKKPVDNLSNLIGFNFRLGEIEAAMGIEQLKKLPRLAQEKTRVGDKLRDALTAFPGLRVPATLKNCSHVYYVFGLQLDKSLPVRRSTIARALREEGIPHVMEGYANLHLLPMFQKKIAYGTRGFPWRIGNTESKVSYAKGICPTAESLQDSEFLGLQPCSHRYSDEDVQKVIHAFEKIWAQFDELKKWEDAHAL